MLKKKIPEGTPMAKICRFLVDVLFIELHHRSPQQWLDTESVLGNRVKHSNRNRKNVCSKSPRQGKQSNQKGNQKREQEKQEGRQDGRQEGSEEGSEEGSDEGNEEGWHFQGDKKGDKALTARRIHFLQWTQESDRRSW